MHETRCLEINVMQVVMFEIARGALDLMINGENQQKGNKNAKLHGS